MFIPGIAAATAYEIGELCQEEEKRIEAEEAAEEETPETYDRVLKRMEKEVEEVIEEDEKKEKKEAKIIAHLQEKLEKEERKYVDMQEELVKEEEIEAELEEEKLKKAEQKLKKLREGHDDGKIGEVFEEVKDCAKGVLGNIAEFAHLMFADERELRLRERAIERGELDDDEESDTFENKRQKRLNEAAKRVEDLRTELANKQRAMVEEDDELLKKELQKIEHLKQQLDEEERKYAEIVAELTEELQYEAKIHEEERRMKEVELRSLD